MVKERITICHRYTQSVWTAGRMKRKWSRCQRVWLETGAWGEVIREWKWRWDEREWKHWQRQLQTVERLGLQSKICILSFNLGEHFCTLNSQKELLATIKCQYCYYRLGVWKDMITIHEWNHQPAIFLQRIGNTNTAELTWLDLLLSAQVSDSEINISC